jgi:hypothetical protein
MDFKRSLIVVAGCWLLAALYIIFQIRISFHDAYIDRPDVYTTTNATTSFSQVSRTCTEEGVTA